ncbi:threonine efflux protein [Deinobacterium chartae]|uniref:Threonine efflux protein n=1 Tax=Deinobacterium chartae TaxID=521158 RepID=A0A841HUX0_9DEIO|nr:homoserine/threonine efflux transporter [Deinobacterium chartae]MBB6096716.1 threonine efflux protein [Deinobacterium chartae]
MATLLTLLLVHLIVLITPGPDFFIVSKTALARSKRVAMATVLGITTGVGLWALLSLIGIHVLFERLAWIQTVLKLAGGAYLLYLGFLMWRGTLGPAAQAPAGETPLAGSAWLGFRSGLLTNLSNPKAIAYFGSIFSTLVTPESGAGLRAAMFAIVLVETFAWFTLVTYLLSLPRMQAAYRRAQVWIDRVAGTVVAGFGLRLLAFSRS